MRFPLNNDVSAADNGGDGNDEDRGTGDDIKTMVLMLWRYDNDDCILMIFSPNRHRATKSRYVSKCNVHTRKETDDQSLSPWCNIPR